MYGTIIGHRATQSVRKETGEVSVWHELYVGAKDNSTAGVRVSTVRFPESADTPVAELIPGNVVMIDTRDVTTRTGAHFSVVDSIRVFGPDKDYCCEVGA